MENYNYRRFNSPLSPNPSKSLTDHHKHYNRLFIMSYCFFIFSLLVIFVVRFLCQRNRSGRAGGVVNSSLVQQLPMVVYDEYIKKEEGLMCSICLMDFEDTEFLRLLPKCEHAFHSLCIEEWLKISMVCPVCRSLVEETDVDLIPNMNIISQEQ
ncbi:E3 ubiquitin-protein ligase, ATL family [Zostera marina]|uniref:E3 ubiquitin-protein ligase, ATL family n=1 Tax=Zostera marina TaxID=29655 RepID=A0A0K9Q3P1_ZOSMR|nr:E3 ubiquitin-protein ligase, ATL family [Zostera marina]